MAQNEGYSAPFVLQDILAQKRQAQHQKLLETLGVLEQKATMEHQQKQAIQDAAELEATKEYRKGTLAEQAADRASREKIAAMPQREQPENPMFIVGPSGKISPAIDPTTGQPIKSRGANPLLELNYPPQSPAAAQPSLYQVPDPQHPGQFLSHWLKPGEQPNEQNKIGGLAIRKGNEPTADNNRGPSPAEFINLAKLAGKATSTPGRLWGTNPAKPQDIAAYNQALNNIVARYNAPPEIVEGVLQALQEDPNIPTQQILDAQAKSGATPEELAKFRQLLTIARGQ